jgi:poly(3-hydroxybutyrate) depolymerase
MAAKGVLMALVADTSWFSARAVVLTIALTAGPGCASGEGAMASAGAAGEPAEKTTSRQEAGGSRAVAAGAESGGNTATASGGVSGATTAPGQGGAAGAATPPDGMSQPGAASGGNSGTAGSTGDGRAGGASTDDGGSAVDGAGMSPESACTVTSQSATCTTNSIVSVTNGGDTRRVYWNTPSTPPPARGWPAVILYQGSFFGPSTSWNVSLAMDTAFGGYYQVALIAKLLDRGFVVVQPEAPGGIAWSTNNGADYDTSQDGAFIPALLDLIKGGKFGTVDTNRLYATGISSGGYMTSRMAVSYAGRFRALAIQSGSYATCLGPLCAIPPALPADHPPTLFLHGGADNIVPIATAKAYYDELVKQKIDAKFDEDPDASHEWLSVAPDDVTTWFMTH